MDAKEFGQRIYQLRLKEGWTQEGCAERAGISVRTIQMIESYQIIPTVDTVEKLLGAFECDWNDLLGQPTAIISAASSDIFKSLKKKNSTKRK